MSLSHLIEYRPMNSSKSSLGTSYTGITDKFSFPGQISLKSKATGRDFLVFLVDLCSAFNDRNDTFRVTIHAMS